MTDKITVTLTAAQVKDICYAIDDFVDDLQETIAGGDDFVLSQEVLQQHKDAQAKYRNMSKQLAEAIGTDIEPGTGFLIGDDGVLRTYILCPVGGG